MNLNRLISGIRKEKGEMKKQLSLFLALIILSSGSLLGLMKQVAAVQTIAISGTCYYIDNSNNQRPIRHATVKLMDKTWYGVDRQLTDIYGNPCTVLTDSTTGFFQFNPVDNVDELGGSGTLDIFIEVSCESDVVKVLPLLPIDLWPYRGYSDVVWDVTGNVGLTYTCNDPEKKGSWGIYDSILDAHDKIYGLVGYSIPKINVVWPWPWTHFNDLWILKYIGIQSNYAWDSAAVCHEYGHWVMNQLYEGNVPNVNYGSDGVHYWDSHETAVTAWIEGWANFFSCVSRDTQNFWTYDVDSNSPKGSDVEGAVAGILWDVIDSTQDGRDQMASSFSLVWDTVGQYLTANHHCYTIYDFHNGWLAGGHDQVTELDAIFLDHGVRAGPDNFGYTCEDTDTYGGPSYHWTEISGTGTEILPSSDDSWVGNIDLGFFFNYYGTDYSQIAIGNNGILFSGVGTSQYINQPIGQTPNIHGFIAPYWDDVVTWNSAGSVYYETLGTAPNRMFVVEWYNNGHYHDSSGFVTFETILYEGTNNILYQYKDVTFGSVSGAVGGDNPPYDYGGSATVGIEDPTGNIGLQYSYNEQVIYTGLAILFKFPTFVGTNMYLSMNAPASMDHGSTMTYTMYYNDFGAVAAQSVALQVTLSSSVDFVSASDGGTYDSATRQVTWNIGTVPAYPSGRGTRTVTVTIPASVPVGTVVQITASISTTTLETRIDDNSASAQTTVTGSNLPPNVSIGPTLGNSGGTPSVYWTTPITFTYYDAAATGVDIRIHLDDGGADMTGSMTGGPPTWTYTVTFYPRHGHATVTYTVHYPATTSQVNFNIYVDPAGYIYNVVTLQRISGASVWLQRSDGQGGWENVPTGQTPPIMQPDVNPQITGTDGQYEWDVLEGSYRVHVEAPGYYPADSIVVNVPPPVADLHIGLTSLPPPPDPIPPTTTYTIGNPRYTDPSGIAYVTSATPITLSAEDNVGGSGVAATGYCVRNAASYNSGWTTSTPPIEFYLTGLDDGEYFIDFNSTDNVGNIESTQMISVTLDNSGPLMIVENPPAGWALQDGVTFIASATDLCGTNSLNFSIREANGDQGIAVGFEDMPATYNATTGKWELFFNTLQLPDGFYTVLVNAEDNLGNTASITVPYSIRNWAVLELLPATPNNKAGRTMPIKFALRVTAAVDPDQPFVYNEELTIKIYATDNPRNVLQTSTFGDTAKDYRINTLAEHYITNFQTLKTPKTYIAGIWRKDMLLGNIEFETVASKGIIAENFEFTRIY
jgi:hypothetical protein